MVAKYVKSKKSRKKRSCKYGRKPSGKCRTKRSFDKMKPKKSRKKRSCKYGRKPSGKCRTKRSFDKARNPKKSRKKRSCKYGRKPSGKCRTKRSFERMRSVESVSSFSTTSSISSISSISSYSSDSDYSLSPARSYRVIPFGKYTKKGRNDVAFNRLKGYEKTNSFISRYPTVLPREFDVVKTFKLDNAVGVYLIRNDEGEERVIKILPGTDGAREIKTSIEAYEKGFGPKIYNSGIDMESSRGFYFSFMEMEKIDGVLADYLRKTQLKDNKKLSNIWYQLESLIDRMCKKGLVHGDLHWENISYTPIEGTDKFKIDLIDFGWSKAKIPCNKLLEYSHLYTWIDDDEFNFSNKTRLFFKIKIADAILKASTKGDKYYNGGPIKINLYKDSFGQTRKLYLKLHEAHENAYFLK